MEQIELKTLAVQDWLKTGLRFHRVSTQDNPTDLMTKAMIRRERRSLNLRGSIFTDLSQLAQ